VYIFLKEIGGGFGRIYIPELVFAIILGIFLAIFPIVFSGTLTFLSSTIFGRLQRVKQNYDILDNVNSWFVLLYVSLFAIILLIIHTVLVVFTKSFIPLIVAATSMFFIFLHILKSQYINSQKSKWVFKGTDWIWFAIFLVLSFLFQFIFVLIYLVF